ncbi:unnamed protein product [Amoebophrya sp. A25]|nr:unnamed protein product [Amoebophrya sp. A25]|eukprot:GSA25T00025296001.1
MERLIEVINQLHDVFTSVGFHVEVDLPQIAVIGGQSVGKSSVLESIVGRDFLPRGQGIVTRRPLILQLHNNREGGSSTRNEESAGTGRGNKHQGAVQVVQQGVSPGTPGRTSLTSGSNSFHGSSSSPHTNVAEKANGTTASTVPSQGSLQLGGSQSSSKENPLSTRSSTSSSGARLVPRSSTNSSTATSSDLPQRLPAEYAMFAHTDQIFEDFQAVRKEIERETDRIGGKNKGVSPQPIQLKIFSPNVIDLTLVDLPGTTKVPVGEQPADIELRIRELILSYIRKPNCIILATHAANTDIANSDALALAREVDPDGDRTIGVITKCDLMDEGTDAIDMLEGRIVPLRQGYVGVVCRNAKDTTNHAKSVKDALSEEASFFRQHAAYRNIAHRCGIPYLSQLLNRRLMYHIRDTIPDLKIRLMRSIHETEAELQSYGDPLFEKDGSSQGALLLHLFSKFTRNFCDSIDGKRLKNGSPDQLAGGARLHHIFHEIFSKTISEFDCFHGLCDVEIRTAIRNATGPKAVLFVPEAAFELLVKKQIEKLEEPCLQCIDHVFEELQRIVVECEVPEMRRFVNLRDSIFEVVRGVLKKCLQPTNQMIINLVQIELAYVNTNHPDFIGGSNAIQTSLGHGYTPMAGGITYPPPPPREPQYNAPRRPGELSQTTSITGAAGMSPPLEPQSVKQEVQPSGGFFNFLRGSTSSTAPSYGSGGAGMGSAGHGPRVGALGGAGAAGGSLERFASGISSSDQFFATGAAIKLPHMPPTVYPSEDLSDRERVEINIIKTLIASYYGIVKKNIVDAVPKSIMYFMVNTAKDVLQRECVAQLYKPELFQHLLTEAGDIKERRIRGKETLKTLRHSVEILNQVRDYHVG